MQDIRLLFGDRARIDARAWLVGQRLDTRGLEVREPLAESPLTLSLGERSYAIAFRFGGLVFFGTTPEEEQAFVDGISHLVTAPIEPPEIEQVQIRLDPDREGRFDADGTLMLGELALDRLQIVGHVLVKSTVLAHYEERIGQVLNRIEPLAATMQHGKWGRIPARALLRQIGSVLSAQTLTMGRVEVTEKPELTWDRPDLDRLYARLSSEYELRERDRALMRKLELITRTSETLLDLLQNRRMLHVELYIVLLIAIEIVIMVIEMNAGH